MFIYIGLIRSPLIVHQIACKRNAFNAEQVPNYKYIPSPGLESNDSSYVRTALTDWLVYVIFMYDVLHNKKKEPVS